MFIQALNKHNPQGPAPQPFTSNQQELKEGYHVREPPTQIGTGFLYRPEESLCIIFKMDQEVCGGTGGAGGGGAGYLRKRLMWCGLHFKVSL